MSDFSKHDITNLTWEQGSIGPMAKSAPMRIIQMGRLEGRLNARSRPVITADPSNKVFSFFLRIYLQIAHSKKQQAATLVAVTMTEPKPKK